MKKVSLGEYHDIPSEIFCGGVPKELVGKFFSVSRISRTEIFLHKRDLS